MINYPYIPMYICEFLSLKLLDNYIKVDNEYQFLKYF